VFSAQIFQENTFLKTKLNFTLTKKCFPLINFLNVKQTQENLKSNFPESEFRETNIALDLAETYKLKVIYIIVIIIPIIIVII
jgi:hypothetical protein